MKYSIGDIITDQRNNSVEITEIRGSCYVGRHIGRWKNSLEFCVDSCKLDAPDDLNVLTLAERIDNARQRLARLQSEGRPTEHIEAFLSRMESI